ncbi:MAG: FeoB-associated Cys-rich membrane protein [Eubacteriales bacterium]|nr:FeoB-associated Cys-rich membrane protein [Eubacteriales bacterium]
MLNWISANIGTIVISLILLAIVGLIIRSLLRQKQQGKSSCGCNCAHCAMHGSCHSHAPSQGKQ